MIETIVALVCLLCAVLGVAILMLNADIKQLRSQLTQGETNGN